MVAAYVAGESSEVLAERFDVAANSVLRLLHQRGVAIRCGKVSLADVERMIRLYQAGLTQQAVGERFGITRAAVRRTLVSRGVVLRDRTGRP